MRKIVSVLLLGLMLSGCMFVHKMDIEQGNVYTPEMVQKLHIGMTRKEVTEIMGTPVLMNTFDDNRVDYVYTYQPGGKNRVEKSFTLIFRGNRLVAIEGDMYSLCVVR